MKIPETCISMQCYMEYLPSLNIYWVHMYTSTLFNHYSYDYRNCKLLNSSHVLSVCLVSRCKFILLNSLNLVMFRLLCILLYIIGDVLCDEYLLLSDYLVIRYMLNYSLEHSWFTSRGTFL